MKTLTRLSLSFFVLCLSSALLYAQDQLWGMTRDGGAHGVGSIFKTAPDGTGLTKVHDFVTPYHGSTPMYTSLIKASNGKLYGMTMGGGIYNSGVLFEYDPATSMYTRKYDFPANAYPYGSLTLGSNNKLYGTTYGAGANGYGTIFEYDPATNTFVTKFDLNSGTGQYPKAGLTQASNGKFYGVTTYGGSGPGVGKIIEYDLTANTCIARHTFSSTHGIEVVGELIEASNGKLYGVAQGGGTTGAGTIFEFDPAGGPLGTGLFTKKMDFSASVSGSAPFGGMAKAANQKLYGTTRSGGPSGYGVLFEYDPATNVYTKKFDFDVTNGASPKGKLFVASNGKLYGTTEQGGAAGGGVIFEFDATAFTFTKKYDLPGSTPEGGLAEGATGKFYGLGSRFSGTTGCGTLFEYTLSTNVFSKKFDFNSAAAGANYNWLPTSIPNELMQASNGKLYGTTTYGGTSNLGVLFEFNPATNAYVKRTDFTGANGATPVGRLIQAYNGKLYGVTAAGGTLNQSVLFEFNPSTNVYTKKFEFLQATTGAYFNTGLVRAASGKLYGVTVTNPPPINTGNIIEFDPASGSVVVKATLPVGVGGSTSFITMASNGKIYGITASGAANGYGCIFEYNVTTNTVTNLHDFNQQYARTTLIEYQPGKLLGATQQSSPAWGTIFELDMTTNAYTTKFSGNAYAYNGLAWLTLSSENKVIGTTQSLTPSVFEYTPATPAVTMRSTFSYPTGLTPSGSLLFQRPDVFSTTPADGAVNLNVSLNVTSKTVSGASTYTIEVSPDPNFVTGVIIKSGTNVQNFLLPSYNTLYYVRVKTNLNSTYGNVTTFTTAPSEFFAKVTTPANAATVVDVSALTVQSAAVNYATTYTIQLSTASDFSTYAELTGSRTQVFDNLAFSTLYYTRVKTDLSPNWGPTTTFTTGDAVSLSYVTTPANNTTAQNWSLNVTVNTLPGATSYTLELAQDVNFTVDVRSATNASPLLAFSGLAYSTLYYSRVKSSLNPAWGPTRNFTTDHPANRSYTTNPANGATDQLWSLNIFSNTVTDATTYTIQISPQADFSSGIIQSSGGTTSLPFSGLAYNTLYYTRVSTNLVPGVWGATRSFTTGNPTSVMYITSPAQGATNVAIAVNVQARNLPGLGYTSYTIELNTAADFTGTSVVQTSSSRTINFSGLSPSTTYYSRVSTNLSSGAWGPTRSFTTTFGARMAAPEEVVIEENQKEFSVAVYGNPFVGDLEFSIESPKEAQAQITLLDVTGKQMYAGSVQTNTRNKLSLGLTGGVYLLRANCFGKQVVVRVLKVD